MALLVGVNGGDGYGVDSGLQGGPSGVSPVAVTQSGNDVRGRKSSKNVVKITKNGWPILGLTWPNPILPRDTV